MTWKKNSVSDFFSSSYIRTDAHWADDKIHDKLIYYFKPGINVTVRKCPIKWTVNSFTRNVSCIIFYLFLQVSDSSYHITVYTLLTVIQIRHESSNNSSFILSSNDKLWWWFHFESVESKFLQYNVDDLQYLQLCLKKGWWRSMRESPGRAWPRPSFFVLVTISRRLYTVLSCNNR